MNPTTLAQIIREVDGNHDIGAAALAEAIMAHPGFKQESEPTPQKRCNSVFDHRKCKLELGHAGNHVAANGLEWVGMGDSDAERFNEAIEADADRFTRRVAFRDPLPCPEDLTELRDEFAKAALPSIIARLEDPWTAAARTSASAEAYLYADECLKARELENS